jgi:hypothetical protein
VDLSSTEFAEWLLLNPDVLEINSKVKQKRLEDG